MWRLMLVVAALSLSACGDRFPDYRYKMTIYVDTPQGERAFSTVREIEMTERSTILDTSGVTIDTKVRGEAVVIDLPSGPVFALLTLPPDGQSLGPEHAEKVAKTALMPHISKEAFDNYGRSGGKNDPLANDVIAFNEMVDVKGPKELSRTRPMGSHTGKIQKLWPMFVRFHDLKDQQSAYLVQPEEIGVKRITIEITDDDVSSEIEDVLPWLSELLERGGALDGTRFTSNTVLKSNIGGRSFLAK